MKIRKLVVLTISAACFVTRVHAQWDYTASGPWADFNFGTWTVYQDEWGSSAPCDLYANWSGNFACAGNWTGGGTKNYCHTQASPWLPLGGGHWCTSNFNISAPGGATYDYMYDLWTWNYQDEVMVYEQWTTPTGGWGKEIASNVSIAGRTWQVWQVNDGHNILMFFGDQRSSGSEDLYSIMNWCNENHLLSNSTFMEASFGVEVTSTSGWQQFTVNSFWAGWQ